MATMKIVSSSNVALRLSGSRPVARPALPARCMRVRAQVDKKVEMNAEVSKVVAISSAAATLFYSGSALAAQELISVAESDGRVAVIATLFVPALAWVGFNMLQPLTNQLNKMAEDRDSTKRSVAAAVGPGAAAFLLADNAEAATQVAQLAESDGRVAVIATLFVPALAWVGFNMLQPLTNQLNKMAEDRDSTKRSVAAAVGLGAAAFLLADNADAATQVAQLAESDGRVGVIATLFVPALGWVGFNMLQPLTNQLNKMAEDRDSTKRSVAAAVGLGAAASMLLAGSADAATQIAQLAESDGRVGVIATLFVPALGWVGFNMLQPLTNQLNKMAEDRDSTKRSVAAAVGLGAAAFLLADNADAATQVAQLAESDGRVGVIATLFVPALGWVGFNMLQPLTNQLNKMAEDRDATRQ